MRSQIFVKAGEQRARQVTTGVFIHNYKESRDSALFSPKMRTKRRVMAVLAE